MSSYINNVLKEWKQVNGQWVKRTKGEIKKKEAAKKKGSNYVSPKKALKQRFDACKSRTKDRINSEPSEGEKRIIKFLTENNIHFIREYYNPKLFNPETNNMLYFDFYVPKYNLLIEFDGIHHFKPVYGEAKLKDQKHRDKVKDKWCSKRGWPLLRINCFQMDKIEDYICEAFDKLDPIVT
jgi:hypothetical protein